MTTELFEQAERQYELAVFGGERSAPDAADRALDHAQARLSLLRGKTAHARWLRAQDDDQQATAEHLEQASLESAEALFRGVGDDRGHGESLFWLGVFHQVVRRDPQKALPFLEQARDNARRTGDRATAAYALRHLGIGEHMAGRLDTARGLLEQSCRLREDLGFDAGVAANLVGLAYISTAQGDAADARRLLDRADDLAVRAHAHGVLAQVRQAREQFAE